MNAFAALFRDWLRRETGIDPDSLGHDFLSRALTERVHALQCDGERLPSAARAPVTTEALRAYWARLHACADERRALIELFVVPETWFFRDGAAFAALARRAAERVACAPGRVIRVLSAPCSTGEEPYSAAMALLDAGLDPASFAIDALDLSARAIEHARAGCYGRNAFRGTQTAFRTRFFTPTADGWLLDEQVRSRVQFRQANLMEACADTGVRYDFVFCRNVLIYFDRDAQDRAIRQLASRLADDGMLFVGPAETGVAMRCGMRSARVPLAFAFQRADVGAAADECVGRHVEGEGSYTRMARGGALGAGATSGAAMAMPLASASATAVASAPVLMSASASASAGALVSAATPSATATALASASMSPSVSALASAMPLASARTSASVSATASASSSPTSATRALHAVVSQPSGLDAAFAAPPTAFQPRAPSPFEPAAPPPADPLVHARSPSPSPANAVDAPTLEQAQALANAGAFDEAERMLARFSAHAGPHADAYYLNGLIADARGRAEEAGDFYRKALYLRPTHHEALTHLATLLDVGGDGAGARWLLERARRAVG
ncbi:CheR family methyltransferase [Burkholderia vietnamiensis]|uniref:CheR family methyltransferase n=1 Tax=Burkholderia vietnamiensis TaxID=60552 RepID=UPI0007528C7F|nr:CheR family methyltransferase [Burkholderia vietnamiensis]KVE99649.1 MCP methyltransferase [Burkholderia vietnamiensis]